jgi:hypothetical protein
MKVVGVFVLFRAPLPPKSLELKAKLQELDLATVIRQFSHIALVEWSNYRIQFFSKSLCSQSSNIWNYFVSTSRDFSINGQCLF